MRSGFGRLAESVEDMVRLKHSDAFRRPTVGFACPRSLGSLSPFGVGSVSVSAVTDTVVGRTLIGLLLAYVCCTCTAPGHPELRAAGQRDCGGGTQGRTVPAHRRVLRAGLSLARGCHNACHCTRIMAPAVQSIPHSFPDRSGLHLRSASPLHLLRGGWDYASGVCRRGSRCGSQHAFSRPTTSLS